MLNTKDTLKLKYKQQTYMKDEISIATLFFYQIPLFHSHYPWTSGVFSVSCYSSFVNTSYKQLCGGDNKN